MTVVVVVAGQHSGRFAPPRWCRASLRSRRRSGRRSFLKRRTPVRLPSDEIEIAVAVEIERRHAARSAVAGPAAAEAVAVASVNATSGISGVDQRGLGSGRGDGLGVAALLEVGLGVSDRVAALAEALEDAPSRRGLRLPWPPRMSVFARP